MHDAAGDRQLESGKSGIVAFDEAHEGATGVCVSFRFNRKLLEENSGCTPASPKHLGI